MKVTSPAKLNLHLEVLKKRKDGFHELRTVFQLIDLQDEIEFDITRNKIDLIQSPLPIKDNLILKAANLLKERTKVSKGIKIFLKKKIPMEKGLGGGSSNAATTLVVLNKLWETNLNNDELLEIGLELGSDVPFFIHGINSWAEGRGEIFKPLRLPNQWFLLAFPKTNISTRMAFNDIHIPKTSPITKEEFLDGGSKNSFTDWAKEKFPEINKTFNQLQDLGVPRLTGTGSTLFLSFKNEKEAQKALEVFPQGILVKSLDHSPLKGLME